MTKFSRVLVADGAGFIGRHIVDKLLNQDIEVTVLDNLHGKTGKLNNAGVAENFISLRVACETSA